jgi:hypothetical protein
VDFISSLLTPRQRLLHTFIVLELLIHLYLNEAWFFESESKSDPKPRVWKTFFFFRFVSFFKPCLKQPKMRFEIKIYDELSTKNYNIVDIFIYFMWLNRLGKNVWYFGRIKNIILRTHDTFFYVILQKPLKIVQKLLVLFFELQQSLLFFVQAWYLAAKSVKFWFFLQDLTELFTLVAQKSDFDQIIYFFCLDR